MNYEEDFNSNKDRQSSFGAMYQRKELKVKEKEVSPFRRMVILSVVTFISLLLPHIGIIFYALWHKDKPQDARWPGLAGLAGFIISLAIYFIGIYPQIT
ncbi:MAG: hypothetical protein ACLFRI_05775 [Candidatus Izemoplasmataceae bacterium]